MRKREIIKRDLSPHNVISSDAVGYLCSKMKRKHSSSAHTHTHTHTHNNPVPTAPALTEMQLNITSHPVLVSSHRASRLIVETGGVLMHALMLNVSL